jgi:hypothetical protein
MAAISATVSQTKILEVNIKIKKKICEMRVLRDNPTATCTAVQNISVPIWENKYQY